MTGISTGSTKTPNTIMKVRLIGFAFAVLAPALIGVVEARDDGRYSQSPLKPRFDSLKSGKGPRCSVADGGTVFDAAWASRGGRCRVRFDNEWMEVPDHGR